MQESIPRYARNYSSYQYTPENASRALTLRLSCNPVSMLRRQSCQVPALALRVPLFPHPVEIGMKDIQLCDSALLCSLFVLCFTVAGWSKMIATHIVVTPASGVGLY